MKFNVRKIAGIFLAATLLFSIAYALTNIFALSDTEVSESGKQKSDYLLILIQCILGLVVMALPSFVEKKLSFTLPNKMYLLFFLFLYCAIFLGEVRGFYYIVPHWDTVLHCFSGGMLGVLGYLIVAFFNENQRLHVNLSPLFVALFAFSFAVALGAIWEIYEFAGDGLFGLNMQKFATEDGVLLIGRDAVSDTMKDIIIDTLGALITVIIGFLDNIGIAIKFRKKVSNTIHKVK